jgi:Na+/proline symporter
MHLLDYSIVALYIVVLIGKSLFLAKKAAGGSEDYFLAGKKMPWWALGASGMSSNLDAAGTMTIIALIYTYGLHGFFIEMRGGVVLPIAVFLAFMGKWHQRSNVVTTGEWMHLRFGTGAQGKAARFTAALTYLIVTVGMIVFFLAAAGPFLAAMLPWSVTQCQVAMAVAALIYTMISGLYGVIWTDVVQAGLIGFAAVYVAVLATGYVEPDLLAQWPGASYNAATPELVTGLSNPVDGQIYYAPFLLFLMFWAGKGILEGLGGSGGSAYMAQRFYAARDVPTVKKLCMLWTVLFAFRWPMVLGFAILAIHLGVGQDNPEVILNRVLMSDLFPIGVRGLIVTAIFAASMSTFDSTINAGASYVVRDVWLPLKPKASDKQQVLVGYAASALIVAAGLAIALSIPDGVVRVWVTIVVQFFPAFLLPFALRWFWARFTGWGFTAGVVCGFAAAVGLLFVPGPGALGLPAELSVLIQNGAFTDVFILGTVGLCSLVGCLAGTFATPAVDEKTLYAFYQQIRPLGLWPRSWKQPDRAEHRGDVVRLVVALVWQISTFMLPMLAMLRMWTPLVVLGGVWLVTTVLLLRDAQESGRDATLTV